MEIACVGAGNLTKGLLYPLFSEAGHNVTIICLTEKSRDLLSQGYLFKKIGASVCEHPYTNITVRTLNEITPEELSSFQIVTTAVGKDNISAVANALASSEQHPQLCVLLCENDIECFTLMRDAAPNVYISVVDRIVYSEDKKSITGEEYYSFEVFTKNGKNIPSCITVGVDFQKSYFKKLYLVNTVHAATAWTGYTFGYNTINSALQDKYVYSIVHDVAQELLGILLHKFPNYPKQELYDFTGKTLDRIGNAQLSDPISRVGRNALYKLGRHERFFEPICYARRFSLPHAALLQATSYGLVFHMEVENCIDSRSREELLSYIESA